MSRRIYRAVFRTTYRSLLLNAKEVEKKRPAFLKLVTEALRVPGTFLQTLVLNLADALETTLNI